MKNIKLLFESQSSGKSYRSLYTKDGKKFFRFTNTNGDLNGKLIKQIIDFLNSIMKIGIKLPIIINIGQVRVADKLSYIMLECIVNAILELGYSVNINFVPITNIDTKGIEISPIRLLNEYYRSFSDNRDERESQFKREFKIISKGTIKFRRLISPKANDYLSKFTSDLIFFLKNQYEFRNYRKIEYDEVMVIKLVNSIGELVGNAIEHGGGDCLLDIDISHNFTHSETQEKNTVL